MSGLALGVVGSMVALALARGGSAARRAVPPDLDPSLRFFIRFGTPPRSGRSAIGDAYRWRMAVLTRELVPTHEAGVSVYAAKWDGKRGKWVIPDLYGASYHPTLDELVARACDGDRDIWLVTGEVLRRRGSDGEPLLKNVRVVRRLEVSDILNEEVWPTPDEDVGNCMTREMIALERAAKKAGVGSVEGGLRFLATRGYAPRVAHGDVWIGWHRGSDRVASMPGYDRTKPTIPHTWVAFTAKDGTALVLDPDSPRYDLRISHRNRIMRPESHYQETGGSAARTSQERVSVLAGALYLSRTRYRGFREDTDRVQDVVEGVKQGRRQATRQAAGWLAPPLRGFRGLVVPLPRSEPGRPSMGVLAEELLAAGVGDEVADLLHRSRAVPSSRVLRRQGRPGVSAAEHEATLAVRPSVHDPTTPILLVDDVVTEGNLLTAAVRVLRGAGWTGPIRAAVVGRHEPTAEGMRDRTAIRPRVRMLAVERPQGVAPKARRTGSGAGGAGRYAVIVTDGRRVTDIEIHTGAKAAFRARQEYLPMRATSFQFTNPETPYWVMETQGPEGLVQVIGRYATLREAKEVARRFVRQKAGQRERAPTFGCLPSDIAIFRLDASGGTRVADLSTTFLPRITDPREGSGSKDEEEPAFARWALVTARGRKIQEVRVFTNRDEAVAARAAIPGRGRRLASVHRFTLRQPVWLLVVYDKGRQPFVLAVTWSLGVAKAAARTTYQSVLGDPADVAIYRVEGDRATRVVDAATGFRPRITDDRAGSAAAGPGRWLVVEEQLGAIHSVEMTRYGWEAESLAQSRTHWGPLAWKTWERSHVVPIPGETTPKWVVLSKRDRETWDPPAIFPNVRTARNEAIRRIGSMRRGLNDGDDVWVVRVGEPGSLPKIVAEKRHLPEIPRIYNPRPARPAGTE